MCRRAEEWRSERKIPCFFFTLSHLCVVKGSERREMGTFNRTRLFGVGRKFLFTSSFVKDVFSKGHWWENFIRCHHAGQLARLFDQFPELSRAALTRAQLKSATALLCSPLENGRKVCIYSCSLLVWVNGSNHRGR